MSDLTRYRVQLRAELDGNTLHGHAAVFNQVAEVPGGYEQLAPGSFDDFLSRDDADVVALVEHDMGQLLGRQSSGTLRLRTDDAGLSFEVDLPDTSYANNLRALIQRGDVWGASIGFRPDLGASVWERAADGAQVHTINRVAYLRDVSAVTAPAYAGTGVALRSMELGGRVDNRTALINARHRARVGRRS